MVEPQHHAEGRTEDAPGQDGTESRRGLWRLRRGFLLGLAALFALGWWWMVDMPGESFAGPLAPLAPAEQELAAKLRGHVTTLAGTIGPRSLDDPEGMQRAAEYIEDVLRGLGYEPRREVFRARGEEVYNVVAEIPGHDAGEIVVVGAHYDSVMHRPGANDNASGTAALLELARLRFGVEARRTLRIVFFANEEPPFFQTPEMGSFVHAQRARTAGDDVRAMWSLETLGCYSDEPGSQSYPLPLLGLLYPSRGDFVAFVGSSRSRGLVRCTIERFRHHTRFPSEGAVLPSAVPGVGWSDHWSFWQFGYPALMVTDTAPFRDTTYHTRCDLPENLDYDRLAVVVQGLARTLADLLAAD